MRHLQALTDNWACNPDIAVNHCHSNSCYSPGYDDNSESVSEYEPTVGKLSVLWKFPTFKVTARYIMTMKFSLGIDDNSYLFTINLNNYN